MPVRLAAPLFPSMAETAAEGRPAGPSSPLAAIVAVDERPGSAPARVAGGGDPDEVRKGGDQR
ncbi:hypothetical protein [Tautonia sociabilis]|uniref:Uncharacterized protein n=1 Tax=Tautonia sociabilis TaxID=2080755 RepID=A0A432MJJ6_9BACT|nr:hypothetical protein [Tautonia sociabilis]RUL87308.1 hypothetical protein TsocGM_13095 [Tautonia sociabilis]